MTTIPEREMPAPRLELRWRDLEASEDAYTVECVYSLVLALKKHDIRAERVGPRGGRRPDATEQFVQIGLTLSTGTTETRYYRDVDKIGTPFRDGAHARWDTVQLGNLPIYAVACGRAMLVEKDEPDHA